MTPRLATTKDCDDLVAIHLQAWEETYPGLLPQSEFDRHNHDQRLKIWAAILERHMPVSYLPGIGFAHMGQHRNEDLRAEYPIELYSFYTLRQAHGTGAAQALLAHAIGDSFRPFTADALKSNARAVAFYRKIGGQVLGEIPAETDGMDTTDLRFGWSVPIQL